MNLFPCVRHFHHFLPASHLHPFLTVEIVEKSRQVGRKHPPSDPIVGKEHHHFLAVYGQCRGNLGTDESAADNGKPLPLLGKQSELVVIVQGAKVKDRIGIGRQTPGSASRGQKQLLVMINLPLIVAGEFIRRVDRPHPASQMKRCALHRVFQPYHLRRFALPKVFAQWRPVVGRMSLRANQPNRAFQVNLPDSFDCRHWQSCLRQ